MNKLSVAIILLITALCLAIIVVRPDTLSMLFMLVFMGFVPGTSYIIPSWISLAIITILLVLAIRWLFDTPVYHPHATAKDLERRAHARRKVTKRTRVAARKTHRKLARAKA